MRFDLGKEGYRFDTALRVWMREGYGGIAYSDGDEIETRLQAIVAASADLGVMSVELTRHCTDWPLLYHLSRKRANLLRPFEDLVRGKGVLEIGAGCGAITRYLGETGAEVLALEGSRRRASIVASRCRGLDNVTVVAEAFHHFQAIPQFDVVTLVGVLEYARKFIPSSDTDPVDAMLAHAKGFLKPGGKLIVAIENQLGLKYFAGFPEDHVGRPMFGIEEHYCHDSVVTFGRHELSARVGSAGLKAQQWWYPFPDYKFPSLMVSETGAVPLEGIDLTPVVRSACIGDQQTPQSVSFNQERAWRPIVRNGLLKEVANSFVLLASDHDFSEEKDLPLAVHFATDRRPEFAKKVVFKHAGDGAVTTLQVALYPTATCDEDSFLKIQLVDQPLVKGVLWQDRLVQIMTTPDWTVAEILEWFKVWLDAFYVKINIEEFDNITSRKTSGNYLDAIPKNMVIDEESNAIFFDQEWNYSAEIEVAYVVFRSLLTSFVSVGTVAKPMENDNNNLLSIIIEIGKWSGFNFTEKEVERYLELESEIQQVITGRPGPRFDEIASCGFRVWDTQSSWGAKLTELSDWGQNLQKNLRNSESAREQAESAREQAETALSQSNRSLAQCQQQLADVQRRLMEVSDWAVHVDAHPITHYMRKIGGRYARSICRRLPLSPSVKWQLLGVVRRAVKSMGLSFTSGKDVVEMGKTTDFTTAMPSLPVQDKPDVFVFSLIDWHFRIQRPQHLARGFAKAGHRVFFFTPNFIDEIQPDFAVEPLDPELALYQIKLNLHKAPRIYFSPPTPEARNQLAAGLGRVLGWSNSRQLHLLVQHAFWSPVAEKLPNALLFYDCMDHHEGFSNVPEGLVEIEKDLFQRADMVTVTSSWLEEFALRFNPKVAVIRNACEYTHFSSRPLNVFADAEGRKIIGYYGAIAEWFDGDLLELLAHSFPDCLILLVGDDTVGLGKRLQKFKNVRFTGEVDYTELPFYLYAFDVCLLPFKVLPLTLATNPVKVYEYLSAGKPVVSINLPELAQFGALVERAETAQDFVHLVENALTRLAEGESSIAARHDFAMAQTWTHRIDSFKEEIAKLEFPKVSVIVLTFNNLELTKACLESVDRYSDYPNLEIVVVDNASTDDTQDFLRQFSAGRDDVILILNTENKGFATGNNQGLAAATGDYLILLNNDTHVTPGWVGTLVNHLRRDASIGLIGPVTNNIGNEAKIAIEYDSMAEMLQSAAHYTHANMGRTFSLRTAAFFCVMMARKVYESVGPLDEAFGRGFFEDDDYCRRVEELGLRVVCAEDVFVHHHLSAAFNQLKSQERLALFEQNKAVFETKWGKWMPHRYR